jgi:NADPH:quinone reductase-like Zn-dependent oxidoreductase
MRAIVMHEHGGPEVLVPEDVPVPTPGAGQVLLRVEVCAVSSGEAQMRSGALPVPWPLPAVLGAEAAGTVEQLGDGVDPTLAGARVVAVTGVGSYAEYALANVNMLARIPDQLSTADAVAAAAAGGTALTLLDRAALRPGETVLVEGGSGKVGGYLVHHAHETGARVIATAGTAKGRDRAEALGADVVLDHSEPEWVDALPEPPDVVFELFGDEQAGRVLAATKSGGRVLVYGRFSGSSPVFDPWSVVSRGLTLIGCGGPVWFRDALGIHYPNMVRLLADGGTFKQPIETTLPLARAAEAHRRLDDHTSGRVLLTP